MVLYTHVLLENEIERSVVSGMSSGLWTTMLLIAVLLGGLYLLPARDEAGPPKVTPFNTYIEGVRNAKPTDFVGRADSRVTDADAFAIPVTMVERATRINRFDKGAAL